MKRILIKFINNSEVATDIDDTTTAGSLKKRAQDMIMTRNEITLIYKGEILSDETIIANLPDIEKNFIIGHIKRNRRDPILDLDLPDYPSLSFRPSLSRFLMMRHEQIQRMQRRNIPDPPNFEEMVGNLVEMGFAKDECERALRFAHFNPDSAATMILSGNVPNEVPKEQIAPEDIAFELHGPDSQNYGNELPQESQGDRVIEHRDINEEEEEDNMSDELVEEEEEDMDHFPLDHYIIHDDTSEGDMSDMDSSSMNDTDEEEDDMNEGNIVNPFSPLIREANHPPQSPDVQAPAQAPTQVQASSPTQAQTTAAPAVQRTTPIVIKAKAIDPANHAPEHLPVPQRPLLPPQVPAPPIPFAQMSTNVANIQADRPNNDQNRRGLMSSLSNQDRANIISLVELTGADYSIAVQVYIICNKNLQEATQCLLQ